jgi:hypothetical protein
MLAILHLIGNESALPILGGEENSKSPRIGGFRGLFFLMGANRKPPYPQFWGEKKR